MHTETLMTINATYYNDVIKRDISFFLTLPWFSQDPSNTINTMHVLSIVIFNKFKII